MADRGDKHAYVLSLYRFAVGCSAYTAVPPPPITKRTRTDVQRRARVRSWAVSPLTNDVMNVCVCVCMCVCVKHPLPRERTLGTLRRPDRLRSRAHASTLAPLYVTSAG